MVWFKKGGPTEPLAVTMAGVKLGDRLLVVGARDPVLTAALATKAGLTGHACVVEADESRAQRGATAIEREGALVEVARAPWGMLPYDRASFDVAVVINLLMTMIPEVRVRCLSEIFRVLRPGGRIVVIEPAPRAGLGALINRQTMDPHYLAHGGAKTALKAEGFAGVRVLAERDGTLYVEGAVTSRT